MEVDTLHQHPSIGHLDPGAEGDPGDGLGLEDVQAIEISNGYGEGVPESYCSTVEAVFIWI